MSITNIKRRIAYFYDDKGEFIGKRSFSKTAKTFDFQNRSFNAMPESASFNLIKRWYWDIECYHYNINNPNPFFFDKKGEPIIDSEMYNIQLKTKVARDLNNLANPGLFANLDFKTIMIILIAVAVVYMIASGKIKF